MAAPTQRQRIWGWYFFDWASQPYNTLLITFIFGPYINELIGDGTQAQTVWAIGIAAAGAVIALLSPVLGALADAGSSRMKMIWAFSGLYVLGSAGLWLASPQDLNLPLVLSFFALGMIGMEFATSFTNAWLPELASEDRLGRVSGNGWAFGYLGGLVSLLLILAFFAESAQTGLTFIGIPPAFGLDPELREGTRFVGPFTAIWYAVFMIPFFWWMREPPRAKAEKGALGRAMAELWQTLRNLPRQRNLSAFLLGSMFYRDALNATYAIGGVYAAGVLGWSAIDAGIFGVVAIISGAIFAWLGGGLDDRFGPKPVIIACCVTLAFTALTIASVSRGNLAGFPVAEGSALPDLIFYGVGVVVGAAGGIIQSASRSLMVRLADPARMTEAFGLYALTGKATSFLAPALIGVTTWVSGSQQIGMMPLAALFLLGLILLFWVKADGSNAR